MAENTVGPPLSSPDADKTRDLARLRQATAVATHWLSDDEVRAFVEAVLREVESDDN